MVPLSEFQFSLWGSQRLCYGAVYYGYEDFLVRAFELVTGKTDTRVQNSKFSRDLAAAFSPDLRDFCWSHPAVITGRLVRHALVHNGGRVTPELRNHKHDIRVEDDELHIMPPDTKGLFDVLKDRVMKLAEETVARISSSTLAS